MSLKGFPADLLAASEGTLLWLTTLGTLCVAGLLALFKLVLALRVRAFPAAVRFSGNSYNVA